MIIIKFTIHSYNALSIDDKNKLIQFIKNKYLIDLYTDKEIGLYFDASGHTVSCIRRLESIYRSKAQSALRNKKTCIEKYGVESTNQLESKKEKTKQTCLERYGVDNPYKDSDRMKKAYQEKFGVDNPSKSDIVKEKISNKLLNRSNEEKLETQEKTKQTCLERYGVEYVSQNQDIKNKMKKTNLEKYGVEYSFQSEEVKEKIKQAWINKSNEDKRSIKEKIKRTNIDRYGVEYSFQSEYIKEKIKQTNIKRYGYTSYTKTDEFKNKVSNIAKYKRNNLIHCINNKHIPDTTLKIVSCEKCFKEYINNLDELNKNILYISNNLGYSLSRTGYYINLYNAKSLIHTMTHHSYYEDEITKYMFSLVNYIEQNNRKLIYPQEIDLYISDFKLGIEFNGSYWHSYLYKEIRYHQNKSLRALENGSFIYHIFEYEWNDERKRSIIKSQLKNICHKNENKIYARNCEIKEIKDNDLIRDFLDKNHLQGYRSSNIKLGLFYNNELVSIMTFGKPYLNKSNKYEWELYRFCNKLNTSVIGGFNKLFKYFIRTYNPKNILTYSDFAKGDGHTYEKMGFKKLELTKPNYIWWKKSNDGDEVLSRYQTQMKNEVEIMEENNYLRIYDCGNFKWEWNNET